MKRYAWILLAAAAPLCAQSHHDGRDWRYDEKENAQHTFRYGGAGAKKLEVNILGGFIHVTGISGSEARLSAVKHMYAEYQEAMADAKKDVKLELTQEGNAARAYVDGPFRHDGYHHDNYRVDYEITVEAPLDTELVLHTLNGETVVKQITGDFDVHTLNGRVDLDEMSGAGTVKTLNGKIKITFAKNPAKPLSLNTLNGSMDLYFQPGLNADLTIERLNGAVYSDFDVALRPQTVSGNLGSGRLVYHGGRSMAVRAGSGGPELKFHTLNGTIRLHSK